MSRSCIDPVPSAVGRSSVDSANPMKSAGTSQVPDAGVGRRRVGRWFRARPQKISPVDVVTGEPSARTDLPLDSMVSCCR